jgi:hypothetical protein
MSEWLKEHAWKACVGETLPRVRIPLSPPTSSPPARSLAARAVSRLRAARSRSPLSARIPLSPLSATPRARFCYEFRGFRTRGDSLSIPRGIVNKTWRSLDVARLGDIAEHFSVFEELTPKTLVSRREQPLSLPANVHELRRSQVVIARWEVDKPWRPGANPTTFIFVGLPSPTRRRVIDCLRSASCVECD